jgi:hypothetical protein
MKRKGKETQSQEEPDPGVLACVQLANGKLTAKKNHA